MSILQSQAGRFQRRKPRGRKRLPGGAGGFCGLRALRFEPMEERTLLSVGWQYDHVIVDLRPTVASLPANSLQAFVNRSTIPAARLVFPDASGATQDIGPLGSTSPVGLTPQQIRAAYGINSIAIGSVVGDGTGQTIAIIDAYDDPSLVSSTSANFLTSDLHKFDVQFNLPDPPSFLKLDEHGGTSYPAGDTGWSTEEALDVEWSHALAPKANIILVEATSATDSDLISIAVNTARNWPGVSALSMSFGRSEGGNDTSLGSVFTTPGGHGGVTFLASTGDSGSPGGFPAFAPNVVAVGGTTLTLSGGNYGSETGWSGSGGGQSVYEAKPTYQNGVNSSAYRQIPDVSFDADPASGVAVLDTYGQGGWLQVGGTSVSSPCWAGLVADANQLRVSQGLAPMDGPSQTLPILYAMSSGDFHDITSGSNGGFSAHAGYDEVTGIGSPVANKLAPDFFPTASKGTVAFSARSYELGTTATITVRDSDLSGNGSCPVTVTSSAGDSETLSLAALGGGVFQGSIPTSAGTVIPGDGVLEAVAGGTITATYNDANNGSGSPAVVTDQAAVFSHLQITTTSPLPTAVLGQSYSVTLAATGGVGSDAWSIASGTNYTESDPGTGWLGGGTAQGWQADNASWSLALPWAFPYYGTSYSSVNVCSNGFLDFTSTSTSASNSQAALASAVRIAPLWEDLTTATAGDNIYVTSNANYVAVRWAAHTVSGSYPVNFEAVLYPNGDVKFNYGAAMSGLTPTSGVSRGDSAHYTLSRIDQASSIPANISSLMVHPGTVPPGLSLSSAGVLSGTPTGSAAGYDIPVTVTDSASPQHTATSSLHVNVVTLPLLALAVPANETEGVGTVNGTVTIPAALGSALAVNLVSSDTGRLTVPATVTIPVGQTSASIPITIIDDTLLNGPEAVTITASATGYTPGTGTVMVHDNETATLSVTLPTSAHETAGTVAGTITSSGAPTRNITLQLASSDTTRLTVPSTATLLAGQTTANFTATLL
ncbi:MAG: hypothetical protein ABR915_16840, partial [Thermoguttaceae bacterium]